MRPFRLSALVLSTAIASVSPAAAVSADRAGDAIVIGDDGRALGGGGRTTPFTFDLPDGASCPGDSAHDDYRVQSFIVPAPDDPGALEYDSVKPVGDGRWSLFTLATHPFVHGFTEMSSGRGEPGRVGTLPALSFGVFPPGELPAGNYRIGVACTIDRVTERYWDTQLTLIAADDEAAGFRWEVTDAGGSGGGGLRVELATPVFVAIALVAGGYAARGRLSNLGGRA